MYSPRMSTAGFVNQSKQDDYDDHSTSCKVVLPKQGNSMGASADVGENVGPSQSTAQKHERSRKYEHDKAGTRMSFYSVNVAASKFCAQLVRLYSNGARWRCSGEFRSWSVVRGSEGRGYPSMGGRDARVTILSR